MVARVNAKQAPNPPHIYENLFFNSRLYNSTFKLTPKERHHSHCEPGAVKITEHELQVGPGWESNIQPNQPTNGMLLLGLFGKSLKFHPRLCWILQNYQTFLLGASFGGSKITISHDSFLVRACLIYSVASSLKNVILSGSTLFKTIFSLASSTAGSDVSTPKRI